MELVVNDRSYTLGPKIRWGQAFHDACRNQSNHLRVTRPPPSPSSEIRENGPLLSGFRRLSASLHGVQPVHGVFPHFRETGHDPVSSPVPRRSRGGYHRPLALVLVSSRGIDP